MKEWHFGTAYELISDVVGDQTALICDGVTRTWSEYDDRSARLAGFLVSEGLSTESKVGLYLHNSNEYMEAHHAAMKLRGCPINVNYRYQEDELVYLLNNADAEAVVFHARYADRIDAIKDRLEKARIFVQVPDDSENSLVHGACDYESVIAGYDPMPRVNRKAEDLYMLYTGGTTGLPKGVMYSNGEHCAALCGIGAMLGTPVAQSVSDLSNCIAQTKDLGMLPRGLVCCPLMHGTGIWVGAMITHLTGGAVITVKNLGLDADLLWQHVQNEKATLATIVGDAFARPMLEALEKSKKDGSPYDLSSLKIILSSGVMWSQEVKEGLLNHHDMMLVDAMGSSEGNMGIAIAARGVPPKTASFQANEDVKVFDENDQEVAAGSDQIGMGATPSAMRGYYKDPEKTEKTVRVIGGIRWVFPGDYAKIESDGSMTLLGRGSMCINTAGEKVFPEEVEEALKSHPQVKDCLVVGVPDEKFGERVVALASCSNQSFKESELIDHCRTKVAGYKLPKTVMLVDEVSRAPYGKADYKWAKSRALELLQS